MAANSSYREVTPQPQEADAQKPRSRSSRSAAFTAYPMMIDGASRVHPITKVTMTDVAIAEENPTANAMKNSAIASATNR